MLLQYFHLQLSLLVCATVLQTCSCDNILFQHVTIATWNDTTQAVAVHQNASLLVEGDEISQVYLNGDEVPSIDAETIDMTDKIVVPGFVNTHQHVWQALYKTLDPNLPFAAYFPRLSHLAPISLTLTADDMYSSELMGNLELLSQGTTSWIDITAVLSPETVDAAWRATLASGGRSFYAATLQDRQNFSLAQQITQIQSLAADPNLNNSLVSLGINYDGFVTSTPEDRSGVLDLIQSGDLKFITAHYVGGPFGNANSPELLNRTEWSLLNGSLPIVFSHSSYLTPLDASLLRQNNQYISIAAESEQHANLGNPYSHLIMDQASLSSDSASAYSTSLVVQARLWLQTVRNRLSQTAIDQWFINTNAAMTVDQAFYLATRAGGLALRRPDLGIISPGAKADLVFFDTTGVHIMGWNDAVAAVMYYSNAGDISDVLVGGKFVKKNFSLTFEDFAELKKNFSESVTTFHNRLQNWDFGEVPQWFNLGQYKDVQTVDVVRGNATGY